MTCCHYAPTDNGLSLIVMSPLERLARMAGIAAKVASIESMAWPLGLCVRYGAMARGMGSQIDLIFCVWNERTTRGCIMYLMISVDLCIFVDDKS